MKFYVVLFLMLVLTTGFALAEPNNNGNVGIPQRVALVEKVLEVEQLTKQPQAELLGTDYLVGDTGKLQAYLKVGENPLENAVCYASVLYPNMTYFLENELMFDVGKPFFEGLYYYDFVVPNATGVYPVNAYCFYDAELNNDYVVSYSTDDFDKAIPDIITDLNELDGDIFNLQDKGSCNNQNCSWNATIDLPIGWHTDLLSDIRVLFVGEQSKSVPLYWWVYSPNKSVYYDWFLMDTLKTPYIEQFVVNHSLENDTELVIGFDVFDSQGNSIDIDLLRIDSIYNGSYVSDLRGNNELVVSEGLQNLTVNVEGLTQAEISVVPEYQLAHILLIIIFVVLVFGGYLIPASILGLVYSFIYLDGLLTLVVAGVCALILFKGVKDRNKNN